MSGLSHKSKRKMNNIVKMRYIKDKKKRRRVKRGLAYGGIALGTVAAIAATGGTAMAAAPGAAGAGGAAVGTSGVSGTMAAAGITKAAIAKAAVMGAVTTTGARVASTLGGSIGNKYAKLSMSKSAKRKKNKKKKVKKKSRRPENIYNKKVDDYIREMKAKDEAVQKYKSSRTRSVTKEPQKKPQGRKVS